MPPKPNEAEPLEPPAVPKRPPPEDEDDVVLAGVPKRPPAGLEVLFPKSALVCPGCDVDELAVCPNKPPPLVPDELLLLLVPP